MKLVNTLSILLLAIGAFSCSNASEESITGPQGEKSHIALSADDFMWEETSRTQIEETAANVLFTWTDGDTIAIYPDSGDEVSFAIESGQNSNTAFFDGGGWALREGHTYKAFFPFDWKNRKCDAIEIDYKEQKGTKNSIGEHDWMYAPALSPTANNITFHMEHMGALAKLTIKVPTPGTYSKLTLTTQSGTTFPIVQKVALTNTTPVITAVEQTSALDINCSFTTTADNELKDFYFMMPSVDLSSETFVVTSTPAGIHKEVAARNFQPGRAYHLKEESPLHIMVFSDSHVLPQALVGSQEFLSDSKLGKYSQELFDQAVAQVAAAKPDVLLIPGDMSYNGEKASHVYVAGKLQQLRVQGVKVYVVPGNHDLDETTLPFDYAAGTATAGLPSDEFFSTYHINSTDMPELVASSGLNYMAYPDNKLAILCLNSTLSNAGGHKSAGGLTEATLSWAETQAAAAQASGRNVILMMHHPIAAHFDTQTSIEQEHVANVSSELNTPSLTEVQERLTAAGIHLAFTGHFHVMSTVKVNTTAGELMDACSPANCGYGAAIREARFNRSTHAVTLSTSALQSTASAAISTMTARQALAQERMKNSTRAMLTRIANKLSATVSAETATKIKNAFTSDESVEVYNKLFSALAAGDEETLTTEKTACLTYTNTLFAGLTAGENFMTIMVLNVAKSSLLTIINSIYDNTIDSNFVADADNSIDL